jgi:hypothetical protein
MLLAPDTGPHPKTNDPEIDPVAYPHDRVMLATPITFDTTAIREVPEPDAVLQMTVLSETQRCRPHELQMSSVVFRIVNRPTRIEGVAEFNDALFPLISR